MPMNASTATVRAPFPPLGGHTFRMVKQPRQMDAEEFPSDLSGHFWATSEFRPELDRWAFKVLDYQNNVLLTGLAFSERQAAAIVYAWDRIIVASDDEEDPSMGWQEDPE